MHIFWKDLKRYGFCDKKKFLIYFFKYKEVRFLFWYRTDCFISKLMLRKYCNKYGLEIFSKNIGEGLFICHPIAINVNPKVVIGKNCNIHKGVTIGMENRGARKGAPVLGNDVWIGVNSTVVGKINIGNDVLIAPNTYVNCDVPSHSIVLGNPCKIIHKENATEKYINNHI